MRGTKLLFVHSNFPGQFASVALAAVEAGAQCAAIGSSTARAVPGVKPMLQWSLKRGSTSNIYPLSVRAEADFLRGRATVDCALELKAAGFIPDVIVAHSGWGETLFLREIFPDAKQILYAEYYYHSTGADVGFDPEFPIPATDDPFRVPSKNATLAMALAQADRIVCATQFQAALLPSVFRPRTAVIHEGVDTDRTRAVPKSSIDMSNGVRLDASRPVITFVNRHLEPLRGFHIFMRALPAVLESVPDAEVLIVGDNREGYGFPAPAGSTWKAEMLREVGDRLDMERVHFLGRISRAHLLAAFSISRAHVYYTYPFVLSWSLLEAMACERTIIASDTAPVREVMTDGKDGLLLDFFDVEALSTTLIDCCRHPKKHAALRKAARRTVVEHYDRKRHCIPAWLDLIDSVRRA